jgi:catechol 2,3-dioxygenase-like lactoylglutathione lyase family enzyme
MPSSEINETTIPVFPCRSVDETLDFYRTLGFEVTHQQTSPYVWLAVRRGHFELNFFGDRDLDPTKAFSTCLVIVPEVECSHRAFADALRGKYGKVPTAGIPRITRFRKGQSRFTVVDPSGNSIIYIRRDEPAVEYGGSKKVSGLTRAIENAAILRDMKEDDPAADKVLAVALARYPAAPAIDRARAIAARAELALAMGNAERAQTLRAELQQIPLKEEDRQRFRLELARVSYIARGVCLSA